MSQTREQIRDTVVKRGLNWLYADRAMGAAGAMRSRLIAERLARKTQDGTLGQQTEMHEDRELEDMNVNVGDTYHYESPPPAAGGDSQAKSKMWPYVLAAALAGGGVGLGTAALMNDKPTADTNTDTQYELRLSSEPSHESVPQ